ncbi:hypothetical protein BC629DRAFT_1252915, partial [Irpex lacteus]
EAYALVDSGAGGMFMSEEFALKHKFQVDELSKPIRVYNVDGTENQNGKITHQCQIRMKIGPKEVETKFYVTSI